MTRRKFFKIALTPVGLAFIGMFSFGAVRERLFSLLKRFEYTLGHPALEKGPTGALSDPVLRSLLAMVEALCGGRNESGHYEMLFAWRSENLQGAKLLYDRFVATLNSTAYAAHRLHFHECGLSDRLHLLQKYRVSGPSRWFGNALPFERENLLFYNHIIRPVLRLYSRTDAWVQAGYNSWPGQARGLEHYQTSERQQ